MVDSIQSVSSKPSVREEGSVKPAFPVVAIQVCVLAALLGWLYWPVIYRLVYLWAANTDWSHGFLIPVFGIYYLYLQRHRMPNGLPEPGVLPRLFGAILLTLGFYIYVSCTIARIDYPKGVSLIVSLLGVVLLSCGWWWTRWSWFAIAFLLFAMPLPQRLYVQLTMPMQEIAVWVSSAILPLMIPGLDLHVRRVTVEWAYQSGSGVISVEEACSGMKSLMAISALGVAMAFLSDRPLWQRMIMILSCLPIAIFCNIIRVTATGAFIVLGHQDLAEGTAHMVLGLVTFGLALGLYMGTGYVLSHLFVEHPDDDPQREEAVAGGA